MLRSTFLAGILAAAAQRGVQLVALGDSLALGTGASHADGGFIFRAYRWLLRERPGSTLDTFAIGGATVADVRRLQVDRLAEVAADIVIVCAGGNDVVRRTEPATFAGEYALLVAAIRRRAPRAHLVCCGVPDVALSPIFNGAEHAAIASLAARDDRAVHAAARGAQAAFVDLYGASYRLRTDAKAFLSADRFHPSDAGYARFAELLVAALNVT